MKKDIPIPSEIFYDKRLGSTERLLLITLYSFSNPSTAIAKPSHRGLCLRCGFRSIETVRTALRSLQELDWVTVQSKKGRPNQYKLKPPLNFGGIIEEGARASIESRESRESRESIESKSANSYIISKLAHSNTHTLEHAKHAERAEHARASKSYPEKVQLDQNETEGDHPGADRYVGRNPFDVLGEIFRRGYQEGMHLRDDENESLPTTGKRA